MAIAASKVLLLFFLPSIFLVPSSEASRSKYIQHRKLTREQIFYYEAIQHDVVYPSTSVTVPPYNSALEIITVPSTNPVTVNPSPYSTPLTVPSTTPVPVPNTNPPPAPLTNPVTTPSTNPPVTTHPSPTGGVPVTTPVTPPAVTNPPTTTGKGWCVAKTGAQQGELQAALDYACGIGKADCSAIQPGASCYNPNTLQNHASYAFNNYYQKNPVQTSCDFSGTAAITNVNPSVGSCIFPTSSSSSSPPTSSSPVSATPPPTTSSPVSATPPPTTSSPVSATPPPTTSSPVSATPPPRPSSPVSATPPPRPSSPVSGAPTPPSPSGKTPSTSTPPTALNSSSPPALGGFPTGFGDSPPPVFSTSTSMSSSLQPFIGCIIAVAFVIIGKLVLDDQDLAFCIY